MLNIIRIPAFNDNYLWLFHAYNSQNAYVVDPGDAAPVEAALLAHSLQLAGILITHHHGDHTDGIEALRQERDIPVIGPNSPHITSITQVVGENDSVSLESGRIEFQVLEVPGHTLDHIAYFSTSHKTLFSGDTLFAGGCGRMFEGQPEQMQRSLAKLAALPDDTAVYCAHEYTEANLAFAATVEANNPELQTRVETTRQARSQGQATVPSLMGLEKQTNPFLRVKKASVRRASEAHCGRSLHGPTEVFAAIRRWKDDF